MLPFQLSLLDIPVTKSPCNEIFDKIEIEKLENDTLPLCNTPKGRLISRGAFGHVYHNGDKVIKLSMGIENLVNQMVNSCEYDMENDFNDRYEDLNDELNKNNIFSEIHKIFPDNIVNFYKDESQYCKKIPSEYKIAELIFDKINGVCLYTHLSVKLEQQEIAIDKNKQHHDIVLLIAQLLYVLCYSNINGVFHNDLNSGNIMVYNSNNTKPTYNQLYILDPDNKITLNINADDNNEDEMPIPILIDFTFSRQSDRNKIPVEMAIIMSTIDKIIVRSKKTLYPKTKDFIDRINDELKWMNITEDIQFPLSQHFYDSLPTLNKSNEILLKNLFEYINHELNESMIGGNTYYYKYTKYKIKNNKLKIINNK
jgi:serine/threonine protein kinase